MTQQSVERYDRSNMRKLLIDFPLQIEDAVYIGISAKVSISRDRVKNIVLTGLGGSAIGGDLLRSYLSEKLAVPFIINRHYFLPEFVNTESLVIVSSYSGNTEETIAAHEDAVKRKAQVVCITSNGETEVLAKKFRQSLIKIPGGYPPRAALGYSFFPLLITLSRARFVSSRTKEIQETIRLIRKKAKQYADPASTHNKARDVAEALYKKVPVVYSPAERLDSVNLRWRGQLAENAKVLAFGHVIPEMNHNELVGWKALKRQMEEMAVIFLGDKFAHPRVRFRMKITKDIVSEYAAKVIDVESEGSSLLARMFSLVYLGDWVSFYLAILNGVDPTPVRIIDYLKSELAKV